MALSALQKYDSSYLVGNAFLMGIDEAGRGCLAGPVMAGACVLPVNFFENPDALELSARINDSKQLSASARAIQFEALESLRKAGLMDFAVAQASVAEIDIHNILGATRIAMQRAAELLAQRASDWRLPLLASDADVPHSLDSIQLLVDGRPLRPWPYAHTGIVKGDGKSLAIAMASIAAKQMRDNSMQVLAKQYPLYNLEQHKGYGTKAHREAILQHGPCAAHRALFLRKLLR
tara:strand:- start:278 stop:979 length:702 start_codon:yes stop_codon:yes gene_type:complete